MEYRKGEIGRVFTVRFDEGDDFLAGLTGMVIKENIQSAWFQVLGGLRKAEVVIGPRAPVMPPEPVWRELNGAFEVLGIGSILRDNDEPRIHFHAAMGKHGETLTACVRKNIRVYLVLELFIIELVGMEVSRPWYEAGGFYRTTF